MPDLNNPNTKDWTAVAAKDKTKEKNEKIMTEEMPEITQLSSAECEAKLDASEKKAEEYMNKYMRLLADMENAQRRAERDIDNARNYAIEKFALETLNVADNLERTLDVGVEGNELVQKIYIGVELTMKSLLETLQKFGVEQINPIGEIFNHDLHSAVTVREDKTVKPNTVVQVLQKGYLLKKRLLRPAMVIVSK